MRALLFLLALPGFAAVEGLTVLGTTPTQALISYTAPSSAACDMRVSTRQDFSTLVPDVDPTKYPGSEVDTRAGTILNGAGGRVRTVLIGKQGENAVAVGLDGYTDSRALEAAKGHFFKVNCGGDEAEIGFVTANIQTGDTRGQALLTESSRPFDYKTISANPSAVPSFTDPYTGVRIERPLDQFSFGYGVATTSGSDCNKVVLGIDAACVFTDAAGTNWTATTGTLTDAVRADDANYAEYSGTAQDPLYLRMDMALRYPTSSTPEEVGGLSFQTYAFAALTSDATGDGGAGDFCIVDDVNAPVPQCISPLRTFTLTETQSIIKICKDSPCTTPNNPGDVMFDWTPQANHLYPNTRVYNTVGDLSNWKFTGSAAQATCDGLIVGDKLVAMDSRSYSLRTVTVNSTNCAATPPQVAVDLSYDLTHTGTTGVTLWRVAGFSTNRHIGIRIRKKSTTSASTFQIGYAEWRAARSTPFQFALGSGGFGKRIQTVPTAGGEYLAHFNQHIVGVSYGENGLILKNYGFVYINTNYLGVSGLQSGIGFYTCLGGAAGSDTLWSDTVPGRFYCLLPSNYNNPATSTVDNRKVLVEMNLDISAEKADGVSTASGSPGLGDKAQRITYTTNRVLTQCLAPCTSVDDDYTLYGQLKRFMPTWDHTIYDSFELMSVQGNKLFFYVLTGSQDSHALLLSFDLGNDQLIGSGYVGSYGNTQHLFAGFSIPEAPNCRWCAEHTFQAPLELGGADYTVVEGSDKCPFQVTATSALPACTLNSTCDACPDVSLDGYSYNGLLQCGTLNITSAWDGGWSQPQPANFEEGDPVAPNGCDNGAPNVKGLGIKLQPGDFIYSGGEHVRVLVKSGTVLTLVRGWGGLADAGVYGPKSHGSSDIWTTRCGARGRNPSTANPEFALGIVWWPALDSSGTNPLYTYISSFQNHAAHGNCKALKLEYNVQAHTCDDATSHRTTPSATLRLPASFGGVTAENCSGNACEKHPSYGQVAGNANAKAAFADVHPRLFKGGTTGTAASLVGGYNFTWVWNSTPYWRHYEIEAYTAVSPLRFVNSITPDDPADSGKACLSVVANDCFSGSLANKIYVVAENLDVTFTNGQTAHTCRELEFGAHQGDLCFNEANGISASTTQWRVPSTAETFLNGAAQRVVSKYRRSYRESATENVKQDPLGKTLLARGNYYLWPPPFPEKPDGLNRATFASVPVDIPTVVTGTATAIVEFGYNEQYHCNSSRAAVCIAETDTYNSMTPYLMASETITGLSCASGCTVSVPALRNRALYYRVKLRDGGGATIWTGPTQVQVVN